MNTRKKILKVSRHGICFFFMLASIGCSKLSDQLGARAEKPTVVLAVKEKKRTESSAQSVFNIKRCTLSLLLLLSQIRLINPTSSVSTAQIDYSRYNYDEETINGFKSLLPIVDNAITRLRNSPPMSSIDQSISLLSLFSENIRSRIEIKPLLDELANERKRNRAMPQVCEKTPPKVEYRNIEGNCTKENNQLKECKKEMDDKLLEAVPLVNYTNCITQLGETKVMLEQKNNSNTEKSNELNLLRNKLSTQNITINRLQHQSATQNVIINSLYKAVLSLAQDDFGLIGCNNQSKIEDCNFLIKTCLPVEGEKLKAILDLCKCDNENTAAYNNKLESCSEQIKTQNASQESQQRAKRAAKLSINSQKAETEAKKKQERLNNNQSFNRNNPFRRN